MKISELAKRMILFVCILLAALVAAGVLYYRSLGFLPFAAGACSGAAVNICKILMLDRMIDKVAGMEKEKAGRMVLVQHFLRFLLTGAVLVFAALLPFISIYGAAAGVLTYPIVLFSVKRMELRG